MQTNHFHNLLIPNRYCQYLFFFALTGYPFSMKEQLNRLISLAGTDGGFYIVAIRSFIEYYMRRYFPGFDDSWAITFNTNLYNYKKYLIEQNPGRNLVELSSFKALMDQNTLAEGVFRDFENVSPEEVRAASFNFIRFCRAAGIDEDLLTDLKSGLEYWENRTSRSGDLAELRQARGELERLRRENSTLPARYRELEELRTVRKYLEGRIEALSLEMDREKSGRQELVEELARLREKRTEVRDKISTFGEVNRYLRNLLRVSLYTRTRMEYEQSLTALTEEQKDVLKSITLKNDFLVKGGAGTGKTLVLLEAMKQANDGVLEFASRKMLLLTYTTTLVKYDRYISRILKIGEGNSQIATADRYLNSLFEREYPGKNIEYDLTARLLGEGENPLMADKRLLVREIEDFLWGYGISREEYIDSMISRKGLREKLSREERIEVWNIKEELERKMDGGPVVSRAYSRVMLGRKEPEGEFDHIFVDESQDLFPVELKLLRKLCRVSLIMAGDTDQSIYGIGSPFQRYGGLTPSTTRILKTNFRNTIPIHDLAERFRKREGVHGDGTISPRAFREGPGPELYLSDDTEELYNHLMGKMLIFLRTIEYAPENITILAPGSAFLDKIGARLEAEGIDSVNIKDPDFDFGDTGRVRLSPLHSSKGIDVPVVMLFIPILFYSREIDDEEARNMAGNLLYVSMTRAMENLNIFAKGNTEDPVIRELIDLMREDGA